MAFLTCAVIFESEAGSVYRTEFDHAVRFTASHRCIGYDRGADHEYGVSITPPGHPIECFTGYDTEEEAREAITKYAPRWPNHRRDHARALRTPLGAIA